MSGFRRELRSRYDELRRLYRDLGDTFFARQDWNAEVTARQTLRSDDRIEHWYLAEHFLVAWSNWSGLLERYHRYFGQPDDAFPETWSRLAEKCDVLVYQLAREPELDEIIARSWLDHDRGTEEAGGDTHYDVSGIYIQLTRDHERADLVERAENIRIVPQEEKLSFLLKFAKREVLPTLSKIVERSNQVALDRWTRLPRRVRHQVRMHLRHYLHSVLGVSWLRESLPDRSALLRICWRRPPMAVSLEDYLDADTSTLSVSRSLEQLLERLSIAIADLGYDAILEDIVSGDLIGGDDSLLGSDEVTLIPGDHRDSSRPILLAATRGWDGRDPLSFTKIMRQVRTRLTEAAGAIQFVVILCNCWNSDAFDEEFREELGAFEEKGVRFAFVLVGVPDRVFVPIPVKFDRSSI